MKFKLIVVIVRDHLTDRITDAARAAGATGCTIITSARGEGLKPATTFLGLQLTGQSDVLLLMVEEHLSREILESIGKAGEFDEKPGNGVAFQVDIEDAIGLGSQIATIEREIEEKL
ncbi:MAG: P-II family nitrogen regulator [Hyphomicrobiales bacterium]|nr:P-II family nitrogen regulator [Hyphomicrobiales bacterium]